MSRKYLFSPEKTVILKSQTDDSILFICIDIFNINDIKEFIEINSKRAVDSGIELKVGLFEIFK